MVDLIVRVRKELADAGPDAGPETIAWHLEHHHGHRVSRSTISRHLTRAGLVTPEPKKRPKPSYIGFQASASTLTDNAMVYTVRLAGHGRQGGKNSFEAELSRRHIVQKNSRPGHPTTCGKAEWFQQTLKMWLRAQPVQPTTIAELNALIEIFTIEYNHRRPHRSPPHRATPATLYDSMPKALPGPTPDPETHDRIRHDRVDTAGSVTLRHNSRLHHIGIERDDVKNDPLIGYSDAGTERTDLRTQIRSPAVANAPVEEFTRFLQAHPAIARGSGNEAAMDTHTTDSTMTSELRSVLLELARRQDDLAAHEAAATPY